MVDGGGVGCVARSLVLGGCWLEVGGSVGICLWVSGWCGSAVLEELVVVWRGVWWYVGEWYVVGGGGLLGACWVKGVWWMGGVGCLVCGSRLCAG